MIRLNALSTTFLLLVAASSICYAQESVDQCGAYELAQDIPYDNDDSNALDTIRINYNDCDWNDAFDLLMPKTVHWHIYAIPNGQAPRFSVVPEGLLQAKISNNGRLELEQEPDILQELGYAKGNRIQAGVHVFIPVSQLQNIQIDGTDQSVEVVVDDAALFAGDTVEPPTIRIANSGVDTLLYVKAPFSKVEYSASGVDNTAILEAASGSSIDLSGVNQDVRIKCESVAEVDMSGVDQNCLVQGDYESARLSGVDGVLLVNNIDNNATNGDACHTVDRSGVDTKCRATTETVSVPELDCLSDTTIILASGLTKGGWVGVILAVIVVLGACIGSCVFCCCRPGRRSAQYPYPKGGDMAFPPPPLPVMESKASPVPPRESSVVEAEVIGIVEDHPQEADLEEARTAETMSNNEVDSKVQHY